MLLLSIQALFFIFGNDSSKPFHCKTCLLFCHEGSLNPNLKSTAYVLPVCCSTRHIDSHRKESPHHDTAITSFYGGHAGIYFAVSKLRILSKDAEIYFFVAQRPSEKCPFSVDSYALLCVCGYNATRSRGRNTC